jgi:hypothetical protein
VKILKDYTEFPAQIGYVFLFDLREVIAAYHSFSRPDRYIGIHTFDQAALAAACLAYQIDEVAHLYVKGDIPEYQACALIQVYMMI